MFLLSEATVILFTADKSNDNDCLNSVSYNNSNSTAAAAGVRRPCRSLTELRIHLTVIVNRRVDNRYLCRYPVCSCGAMVTLSHLTDL